MSETTEQAAATAGATLASLLIQGQQAQALIVAAQLGIADQLADGPRHAEELAAAIGAHSPALYRLLRALASLGAFAILDDGRFALMPLAEPLRTDVPGSLRALAQSALPGSRRARGSRAAQMRLVAGCVQR
jgi:DNA-binding IclR family transcriptional regulator